MSDKLQSVDPTWAWAPFEPSADRPWDRRASAHLFRRAGFGATCRELDDALKQPPSAVVARLIAGGADPAFDQELETLTRGLQSARGVENLSAWWLYRMLHTPETFTGESTAAIDGDGSMSLVSDRGARCTGPYRQVPNDNAAEVGAGASNSGVAKLTCSDGRTGSVMFTLGADQAIGTGMLGQDIVTLTIVPSAPLATSMRPPWSATKLCTIDIPMPVPPSFVEKNGS